jgi:hypothetical protein
MGPAYNTTNGQDYGSAELGFTFTAGSGQVKIDTNPPGGNTQIVAGDLVKNYNQSFYAGGGVTVDQLDPTRQYVVMAPIDNYPSQCPVAGQAFTGFTSGGTPSVH